LQSNREHKQFGHSRFRNFIFVFALRKNQWFRLISLGKKAMCTRILFIVRLVLYTVCLPNIIIIIIIIYRYIVHKKRRVRVREWTLHRLEDVGNCCFDYYCSMEYTGYRISDIRRSIIVKKKKKTYYTCQINELHVARSRKRHIPNGKSPIPARV